METGLAEKVLDLPKCSLANLLSTSTSLTYVCFAEKSSLKRSFFVMNTGSTSTSIPDQREARLLLSKFLLNFQLHAQYSASKDEYISHRVSQAFELSEFVRLTASTSDVVIVGGDFNLDPADLGYKVIISNAALQDAWVTQVRSIVPWRNFSTFQKESKVFSCFQNLPPFLVAVCAFFSARNIRVECFLFFPSGCKTRG